ncbi:MAG: ATP-binding protein [Synergistaceae bacterium]|nr:ATP-binding protein [Synergistaceae bacterium]
MHRLIIHNLGPIDECEITCRPFMVLTGEQASGKSTIAKALYYFRTVKDDVFEEFLTKLPANLKQENKPLIKDLRETLRRKFLRTFGYSVRELRKGMRLRYFYTQEYSITVRLIVSKTSDRKILNVELSKPLTEAIAEYEKRIAFETEKLLIKKTFASIMSDLNQIFDDEHNTVYLPSGRSMLSFMSSYIRPLNIQGDIGLDYCTQKYIEDISNIRHELNGGLDGLMDYYSKGSNIPKSWLKALELIEKVLCGTYRIENGEERIILNDGNYVRINFASSGQQDALWITNLLFYYLVSLRPTMFIIEEPESHLFPSSQKHIMELVSLVCNHGHSVLVTTHSPYVLGTLNNLLYASSFRRSDKDKREKASKIIPASLWLDYDKFQAWFVKKGKIEDCMDCELKQIRNEVIDGISDVINDDYDKLFDMNNQEEDNAD